MWSFETDPEFQASLDWIDEFTREEIEPLDLVFREPGDPWDPNSPAFAAMAPLREIVKQKQLWACHLEPELGGQGYGQVSLGLMNEILGRSRFGPSVFGCQAPDSGNAEILAKFGTPEQKEKYLKPLLNAEIASCYSMTEPQAGADPGEFLCTATRDGDDWVINGQKIWTSGAHYSDYGVIVVRTDPTVPKHKGLSYFYVDMKAPGVEIKPIKQLTGDSDFNEVYFTDVRVSDSQRLGEVGQGWQVSLTTLMNERAAIGGSFGQMDVSLAMSVAEEVEIDGRPALEDAAVRARIANWYVQEAGLKYTGYRSLTALSRGALPGPENSIGKLVGAPKMQAMSSYLMDLLGASGAIADESLAAKAGIIQRAYLGAPGLRIAGGTDEIMANIIAERVLGLPQEPRLDKGIPFNEVPTG